MNNRESRSLLDVWNIIRERRFETYGHQGILYLRRDEDGVVQERYFNSLDDFEKAYESLRERSECGMFFDLTDK